MKIWIDINMVPRFSPNGWPIEPKSYDDISISAAAQYDENLEKAKSDSIPFEHHTAFYPTLNACTMPDSFIEFEIGEVDVVWQKIEGIIGQKWEDVSLDYYLTMCVSFPDRIRKVARLKPAESDPGVTKYYNAAHGYTDGGEIPIMPSNEKEWREQSHDRDQKIYAEENRLFAFLKSLLIAADIAPIDVDEIASSMMPDIQEYMRQQLTAAEKRIIGLIIFAEMVKEMRDSQEGINGHIEKMHALEDAVDHELKIILDEIK